MKQVNKINLTGMFSPFHQNNQPVLAQMPHQKSLWVVVFSTIEKLEEGVIRLGVEKNYKVKQVEDGQEFAESIFDHKIRIMLDPYCVVEDGKDKTKWTEVFYDDLN